MAAEAAASDAPSAEDLGAAPTPIAPMGARADAWHAPAP